jgi:hypothetical protein
MPVRARKVGHVREERAMVKAPRALVIVGSAVVATATAAGATGAGVAGATGNSGSANVPTTLAGIKLKAAAEINRRLHDLTAAVALANQRRGSAPAGPRWWPTSEETSNR